MTRSHRKLAAAWSAFIAAAIAAVGAAWLILWPLTLPLELLFRSHLVARVRALEQQKLHVPAALRVRAALRCVRPCGARRRRPRPSLFS
jgi:hypothetical protein